MNNSQTVTRNARCQRLPDWMRQRISLSQEVLSMKHFLRDQAVHTVCQSAGCPNLSHCFQKSIATFLILGNVCTRHCAFCGITQSKPLQVDYEEPEHVAEAAFILHLKHVVITSVTRDDLPDGGAFQFVSTVKAVKQKLPNATVEALIPDFQGDENALQQVIDSGIDVLNHNVETVPRLYPTIRPEADFDRSIQILAIAKTYRPDLITKSGLMLGLGENESEIVQVFKALREAACDALTIGQYLAPGVHKAPVREFLHPTLFKRYHDIAKEMRFDFVKAGPYVRSSYHADEMMKQIRGAKT